MANKLRGINLRCSGWCEVGSKCFGQPVPCLGLLNQVKVHTETESSCSWFIWVIIHLELEMRSRREFEVFEQVVWTCLLMATILWSTLAVPLKIMVFSWRGFALHFARGGYSSYRIRSVVCKYLLIPQMSVSVWPSVFGTRWTDLMEPRHVYCKLPDEVQCQIWCHLDMFNMNKNWINRWLVLLSSQWGRGSAHSQSVNQVKHVFSSSDKLQQWSATGSNHRSESTPAHSVFKAKAQHSFWCCNAHYWVELQRFYFEKVCIWVGRLYGLPNRPLK